MLQPKLHYITISLKRLDLILSSIWKRLSLGLSGKESACQGRKHRFNPWGGKIPRRRKSQPTPVFSPGQSHGQRSLGGGGAYSPWGHKRVGHNWATKEPPPPQQTFGRHQNISRYLGTWILTNASFLSAGGAVAWGCVSSAEVHQKDQVWTSVFNSWILFTKIVTTLTEWWNDRP